MITLAPHTFTATDANRTIDSFPEIWKLLAEGRDASALEPLVPVLTGDVRDDLPAVWAALQAAGPALRAAGQLPAQATGTVHSVHRGSGGVPKAAVDHLEVVWSGVVGDVQSARQHHGRPWQALCIWSTAAIEVLNALGHHLFPGAAGENIVLSGLDWSEVRPGVRLRLGEVLCDVSAYALPCSKNARWFEDRDYQAMHHDRGPVSRVYATVLQPGLIRSGDDAVLEP
jgi:MOSC domain-containing protein YiiM